MSVRKKTNTGTEHFNFTKESLEGIKAPESGRAYARDTKCRGLILQTTPAGRKTFYLYQWIKGRPERVLIGRFGDVTVEQARRKADSMRGEVADGKNPADAKRTARAVFTLGQLFDTYIDRAKDYKRTWRGDKYQYEQHLESWKHRKLSEIRKADVAALHAKIGKAAPVAANRMLALLTTLYSRAASDYGYEGINPCRGVKRFRERKRDRFLQPDELKQFFAALHADETDPAWRDFFALSLLTGARRANVLAMRWDELHLDRGIWTVPDSKSKSGDAMAVYLPTPAIEILTARKKASKSEWVFPSYGPSGHLAEPKMAWADLCKRAKLADVRIHDLRRTLGSWAAITGASLNVIGAALGHRDVATTAIYARLTAAPVRESVEKAAIAMLTAGGVIVEQAEAVKEK